jgi:octaprenyl-diphosphate synthase
MTLPLIIARARGNEEQAEFVKQAILNGGVENLEDMVSVVKDTGGLQYTQELALKQTQSALEAIEHLPGSEFKSALEDMAKFSTARSF